MRIIAKTKKLFRNPSLFIDDYKAKRKKIDLSNISFELEKKIETTAKEEEKKEVKEEKKKEEKKEAKKVEKEEKKKEEKKKEEKKKEEKKKEEKKKKKNPVYFQRVAISKNGQLFYEKLTEICKLINIPFMTGATDDVWMKGIHIDYENLYEFIKVLQYWFSENSYYLKVDNEYFLIKNITSKVDIPKLKYFDLVHVEKEYSSESYTNKYYSLIRVSFWSLQANYSNFPLYTIKENNKYISKLTQDTFKEFVNNNQDLDEFLNVRSSNFSFPIDAVITWVNGDDPEWKSEKEFYSNLHLVNDSNNNTESRANEDERFRNRNELKYLLRSIEMFAPFIRKIFIVTCGQTPEWLNIDNDRIVLVNHNEIYKDKEALPVFNSSSIETQLHHIEGLSEHFIYFNDDFMLTDFCVPNDFFFANGIMKYFPSDTRVFESDIDDSREEYLIADRNAISLIKEDFGKSGNDVMLHCPYPSRKSILSLLEDRFESEFAKCAKERFRSKNDLRPIAFMQYHYGFLRGLAIPSSLTHRYLALYKDTIDRQFNGVFVTRKYKTICINDVAVPTERLSAVNELTIQFLESYFPFESSFEK
ncbi:stealth family protein [Gilliamella apicola]|uniref:stealth family protein n=1 Tax=Gilliamella apicola TaxID=1196095 RepID=UPI003985AA6B